MRPRLPQTHFYATTSQTWTDFRAALSKYVTPAQNFVFADTEGNFGYQMPGFVPRRAPGHSGLFPAPGNGSFAWQRMHKENKHVKEMTSKFTKSEKPKLPPYSSIPFDDLPRTLNPRKGFVASANNQVPPPGFAKPGYVLSGDWDSIDGFRASRITEMLNASALPAGSPFRRPEIEGIAGLGVHSHDGVSGLGSLPAHRYGRAHMEAMQQDYVSGLFRDLAANVLHPMDTSAEPEGGFPLTSSAKAWRLKLLEESSSSFSGNMWVKFVKLASMA